MVCVFVIVDTPKLLPLNSEFQYQIPKHWFSPFLLSVSIINVLTFFLFLLTRPIHGDDSLTPRPLLTSIPVKGMLIGRVKVRCYKGC